MSTKEDKKTTVEATENEKKLPVIPWSLEWPDMKICIASRSGLDKLQPAEQEKVRKEYGDGLVELDFVSARRLDEMHLLVVESSTWNKLPKSVQDKLKDEYGENDGLRIFADGFLMLVNTGDYPTSQRGNTLVFCKLRGRDYVHTAKPAVGYRWQKLATDKEGHTGGYWAQDECDTWLKDEVNRLTDDLWRMFLSVKVDNDDGKDKDTPKDDNKLKKKARNEQMKKWRTIIRDRYDAFANYEFDKIITRIKTEKDKEKVSMNDPEKCSELLPCLNGVYMLKTGDFRSTQKSDHMSYYAPTICDMEAYDENVRDALNLFFDKAQDEDRASGVENYFWELVGTGLCPALRKDTKAMVQLVGTKTNNGKSTLVRALVAALGDSDKNGLAQQVRPEAFAKVAGANTNTLTPDLATIKWARMVFVSEPDENLRINWSQVKNLTSGEQMNISDKNEKMYKIPAQFCMFWDTNYFLRVDDPTIFARGTMKLIPFEHTFLERDRDEDIDKKLSTDTARSYILRLMLEGIRRYMEKKFTVPTVCQKMLKDYEGSSDKLGDFLAQNYVKTGKPSDKIYIRKVVYPRYIEWCAENGYKGVEAPNEFVRKLKNRPGVVVSSRNNAFTLDCYVVRGAAQATAAEVKVPFDGFPNPLAWYLQNFTSAGVAEALPEQMEVEKEEATAPAEAEKEEATATAPALTLGDLMADFQARAKVEDPTAEIQDIWGVWAELNRRHWALVTCQDIAKSEITSHHILTDEELAQKGQERVRAIISNLQRQVDETIEKIDDQETRDAVRFLTNEGPLQQYVTCWNESIRRIVSGAMFGVDSLDTEIMKEAKRIRDAEIEREKLVRAEKERLEKQAEKKPE